MALNRCRVVWKNNLMMSICRGILYLLLVFLLIPAFSSAVRLRQIEKFPLETEVAIYGQSSGNIVVASRSKLTFLNDSLRVRSEIDVDSTQIAAVSPNGLFYAIFEKIESSQSDSLVNSATVYDNRHSPLWGAFDLVDGDYYLSPSGEYIVAASGSRRWFDYELFLYHKELPLTQSEIGYLEEFLFSDDGRYFFVDCGPKGAKLFDAGGTVIREFGVQKRYSFSADGRQLALFNDGSLQVYEEDKKGLSIDFKISLPMALVLCKEIGRAAVVSRRRLVVASVEDGSTLWQKDPDRSGASYVSLDVSPNNKYIACGVDINLGSLVEKSKRHVTGYLYVYDIDGQSVAMIRFSYGAYEYGLPDVKFSPDDKTIVVHTNDTLRLVEMY